MNIANECFRDILSKPEESNSALIKLNTALEELTAKLRTSFSQAMNELIGLRLVSSQKLFDMINEFGSIQKELIEKTTEFMGKWQQFIGKEQSVFEKSDIKSLGMRASSLYEDILKQMRKELKIK